MNGYEGVFGLLLAECNRKERERIEERERMLDAEMAEMAEEVALDNA